MELNLEGCEEISSVAALCGMRKLRALNLKRCSTATGLQHLSGQASQLLLPSCIEAEKM